MLRRQLSHLTAVEGQPKHTELKKLQPKIALSSLQLRPTTQAMEVYVVQGRS